MATRHKHADIIIAWENGAEVQFRETGDPYWTDNVDPRWYEGFEYRIKPTTIRYRVAFFKDSHETWTSTAENENQSCMFEAYDTFDRWITDWIEVEV